MIHIVEKLYMMMVDFPIKAEMVAAIICGGLGVVWGYFPVSPYFQDSEMAIGDNINGGYDFFRRVVRINDNMK